jgi:ribonuclease HI
MSLSIGLIMNKVTIYTDGSCLNNGSSDAPGGWGAVLECEGNFKEISGSERDTTNNRMEILAVIKGFEALKKPCEVTVVTDSNLVVQTYNKGWKRNKNNDLWNRLDSLIKIHKVTFSWIRGHNGHPQNEKANQIAIAAAMALSITLTKE